MLTVSFGQTGASAAITATSKKGKGFEIKQQLKQPQQKAGGGGKAVKAANDKSMRTKQNVEVQEVTQPSILAKSMKKVTAQIKANNQDKISGKSEQMNSVSVE